MGTSYQRPKGSAHADCCNPAELGCEVVGFVGAADCVATLPHSCNEAFIKWIERGYRLEDWEPLASLASGHDPAA